MRLLYEIRTLEKLACMQCTDVSRLRRDDGLHHLLLFLCWAHGGGHQFRGFFDGARFTDDYSLTGLSGACER